MSKKIAIVLVEPYGDANIGQVARAMKNFGLSDLRIVNGVNHLTKQAFMWAVEAADILEGAKTFKNLEDALSDITSAIAFTRRLGKSRKSHMKIGESIPWIAARERKGKIALIFGREDRGLTNEEVRYADLVVTIPTSPKLPSINLAQSVAITCYELFSSKLKKQKMADDAKTLQKFISRKEMDGLMIRINKMLAALGYEDTESIPLKTKISAHFKRIFGRAGLTERDMRMFEGLISRIVKT